MKKLKEKKGISGVDITLAVTILLITIAIAVAFGTRIIASHKKFEERMQLEKYLNLKLIETPIPAEVTYGGRRYTKETNEYASFKETRSGRRYKKQIIYKDSITGEIIVNMMY